MPVIKKENDQTIDLLEKIPEGLLFLPKKVFEYKIKDMKILIGTNNENKLAQFRRIFEMFNSGMEIFLLKEIGIVDDVEEDADNLLDNAKKKAKFYAEISGMLTLADSVMTLFLFPRFLTNIFPN